MQTWSGLTGLREIVERVRPKLRSYRDEQGRVLFDVPDGVIAEVDMPAPVRFLPEYDNTLMGHADRTRVIADGYRTRIFTRGAVMTGGFVSGMWTIKKEGKAPTLDVEIFGRLPKTDRTAVEDEGARLLSFATSSADGAVRFTRF
jgi:hypothetical protein